MNQVTGTWTKSLLTGLCAAALATAAWAAPGSGAEGSFDRTLKVSGPVSLDVRTGSGNIRVHQGDSSNVVIHAEIRSGRGGWGGDSDAESRIREIEKNPPIEQDGSTIHVGRTHDSELYRNISISYEIRTPAQSQLEAQTGSGDLTATGILLEVTGHTGSGNIRVEDTGGRVDLTAGSGDVHLQNARGGARLSTGSGNVTVENVSGGVNASSGSGTVRLEMNGAGDVEASTGSGNIVLRGANGAVRAHTGSGDVEAHGEQRGEWHLRTGSGNLRVELPPGVGFELDAHSGSGTIQTEREIAVQGTLSRRDIHGKAGGGGPLLELRTSSGNIYLR